MDDRATTTGRFSCNEPQVSNTPKMSEEEKNELSKLIAQMLEKASTPEYIAGLKKRIQEDNERYEAYEREQRRLWHKYKDYSYDI